jgi:hypothetical protein
VHVGTFLGGGVPFGGFGFVHQVGQILAGIRSVGGDLRHFQVVDLLKFCFLGFGGTCHARELRIEQEEVLIGNGGEGLGFVLDFDPFLGLDRLVQTVTPAPTGHHPSGKFIDDRHFAALNDVAAILDK